MNSMSLENEVWKWIAGYEGAYMVSSWGRVMSFKYKKNGQLLRPNKANGYFRVVLSKRNVQSGKCVHSLVARAFIKDYDQRKECVDHLNRNKEDNRIENLEIVSYRENTVRGRSCNFKKNRKTVFPGVDKTAEGRYRVRKSFGDKSYSIGTFSVLEDAISAYENSNESDCIKIEDERSKRKASKYKFVLKRHDRGVHCRTWFAKANGVYLGAFYTQEEARDAVELYLKSKSEGIAI